MGERSDDTLLIAAGGGGDAVAALMLADALGASAAGVATFAWERKIFDPLPGPRGPRDFQQLLSHGRNNWRLQPSSRLRAGRSFLPQLAACTSVPLFLLDPSEGAVGLRDQLLELAEIHDVEKTLLVDVGGDVLARGDEAGLRSPLADALTLAATAELPGPSVYCLGLGLDGELAVGEWRALIREARDGGWMCSRPLPQAVASRYRDYFEWHPSEATGMACLSALGYRGSVEMRADGVTVSLSSTSARLYNFSYPQVLERSLIARAVRETTSLRAAASSARSVCGRTELEHERDAVRRHAARPEAATGADAMPALERRLIAYSGHARKRGVDYLTMRRVAEVLELDAAGFDAFRDYLSERRGPLLQLPLWSCRTGRS